MEPNPYQAPSEGVEAARRTRREVLSRPLVQIVIAALSAFVVAPATVVGFLLTMSMAIHNSPLAILSTPNFSYALRHGIVCGLVSIIPVLLVTFAVERRFRVAVAFATTFSLAVITSLGYCVWIGIRLG
jgi:hypothetical protein